MIIKAAKRIFNSDKKCRSYSDLNFGVTFLEHSAELRIKEQAWFYIWCSIPSVPLHVGQNCSFGRQCEHTMWPLWHCMIGGNA